IGVVILLAAITIAVGPSVLNTRRSAASEQIVVGLDGVLETYIQENQGRVPPNNSADYLTVWDRILGASSVDEDVIRTGAIYGSVNDLEGVDSDIEPVFTDSNGEPFPIR